MADKAKRKPNPNRLKLIELSQQAKLLMEISDPELVKIEGAITVNSVIREVIYPDGEYNTFHGWKEEHSMKVKKGSKGYPIWGRKRKFERKNDEGDVDEYNAFPLAYIFHESQVEPLKNNGNE